RFETGTTLRVRTDTRLTVRARTYPSTPFGLIGSWTRYQVDVQSLRRIAETTRKTVGKSLSFRRPKVANGLRPGRRYAVARLSTTAATAKRLDPTGCDPLRQCFGLAFAGWALALGLAVAPQAARRHRRGSEGTHQASRCRTQASLEAISLSGSLLVCPRQCAR